MTTDISPVAVPPRIELALRHASRTTGADFDYLLDTAIRESGLESDAKSGSSSATGLFQFIENTWLGMIKTAGDALGFGDLADKIEQAPDGRYKVADRSVRREILALREDPEAAALMAGAYAREAADALENQLGRNPSHGELYIAHFLGTSGAGRLIETAQRAPDKPAAELFPRAAAANRSIFYDRSGNARSAADVYEDLIAKHESGPVRLAGAEMPEEQAMPVVSPAAARYLKPANLAAAQPEGNASWGRSLFAMTGPSPDTRPRGGPLVLDSARLVALIEENLDLGGSRTASQAVRRGPEQSAQLTARRPLGLLERRAPFIELFRSG